MNSGAPPTDGATDRPEGMGADPQLENEWFRSCRVELGPGKETPTQTHKNPTVVVQVSDGLTHVTRTDGITAKLTEMGDWTWRNPESIFMIRNAGNIPVSVVVDAARRASSNQ